MNFKCTVCGCQGFDEDRFQSSKKDLQLETRLY